MDLRDFVSSTLNQVLDGVGAAQEYASKHGAMVNLTGLEKRNTGMTYVSNFDVRSVQDIEFDVVVSTTEGGELKAGLVCSSGQLPGYASN